MLAKSMFNSRQAQAGEEEAGEEEGRGDGFWSHRSIF
jgi:hypothetical protein